MEHNYIKLLEGNDIITFFQYAAWSRKGFWDELHGFG